MRTFGVVLDSYLHLELNRENFKDASIVSLSFMLRDHEVKDAKTNPSDLLELKSNEIQVIPPKPESFIAAYENQKALGYKDVFVLISSRYLSETFNQVHLAKVILNKDDFHIIDTKTFGSGIEEILYQLDILSRLETSNLSILTKIKDFIDQELTILFTKALPNEKSNLIKNLLPLSYVVSIKDDLEVIKNTFTKNKFFEYLKTLVDNQIKIGLKPYIRLMYQNYKDAKILQQELYTLLNINVYIDSPLPNLIYTKLPKVEFGLTLGRGLE